MSVWQPIDTAPKDGTIILLAGGEDDGACYARDDGQSRFMCAPVRAMWERGSWLIGLAEAGYVGIERINPTHWMPLPKAPGEEAKLLDWPVKFTPAPAHCYNVGDQIVSLGVVTKVTKSDT